MYKLGHMVVLRARLNVERLNGHIEGEQFWAFVDAPEPADAHLITGEWAIKKETTYNRLVGLAGPYYVTVYHYIMKMKEVP